ncbi:SPOR domain-containing protein [Xylella fastidiosa]|nr:SPOR domain-containing protein [Xylella fastidiosa]ALQ93893.1 sporulation protein [Xylella fastidiosa]ALQ96141.1 SPOR domain-containing protein [Xylella fastidiosa]ALR00993.1 sporulation protein [Xylella fastidiosa]ALR07992.2 sporulation protein [Xylella fastidiosa]ETE36280.1 sporulation protein [Xylella fastidiosa 32]
MATPRARNQARRNTNNAPPGWVWLIAGAAITAIVFLAAPRLFKKNDGSLLHIGADSNPSAQPAPVIDHNTPIAQPSKPTTKDKPTPEQQEYDFYTLLPGKEVPTSNGDRIEKANTVPSNTPPKITSTPAQTTTNDPKPLPEPLSPSQAPIPVTPKKPTPAPTSPPPAAIADTTRYILQAGSFGTSNEAESTKARLAMLGLSARIESTNIGGKQLYRVRMGPYSNANELAEARKKIDSNGLQAITIKAH